MSSSRKGRPNHRRGKRLDEFAFIERWLASFESSSPDVLVPPGDDAAVFRPRRGQVIVSTTDALVDGVHFHSDRWPPRSIGHKAMAVNLSDIAAMGAMPRFALLALELPAGCRDRWLGEVARGMSRACDEAGVELIGGNVSGGRDLSLTVCLLGEALPKRLLTRSGAMPGDDIWVSGTVGDSALGLSSMLERSRPPRRLRALELRHCMPRARVELGMALAAGEAATSAIDISDGLAADLGHILESSEVGAEIHLDRLPLSRAYRRAMAGRGDPFSLALSGGEDYELLFTSAPRKRRAVKRASEAAGVAVTAIGRVSSRGGLRLIGPGGAARDIERLGWSHR